MSGYVKTFKVKESNKATSPMIEGFKNLKLNALPVYNYRYTRTKIRTFGNKFYNIHGVDVTEKDTECESFTAISIDFSPVYCKKLFSKYI